MKPREFDELVKQKFDGGGFEYNARNWDTLAEELDGRAKKRGLFMWWMPLIGMAASVALAMGVPVVLREGSGMKTNGNGYFAQAKSAAPAEQPVAAEAVTLNVVKPAMAANTRTKKKATAIAQKEENDNSLAAQPTMPAQHTISLTHTFKTTTTDLFTEDDFTRKKKKLPISAKGLYTFAQEDRVAKTAPKIAIILSGGMNFGAQTSGYMVGATARRMINDKVYVEGDIAFIGSSNTQEILYAEKGSSASPAALLSANGRMAAKNTMTSKNSTDDNSIEGTPTAEVIKSGTKAYNLYYAQVTPTIGYKLMKRMSIGVGPDFQQVLVDNRPERSTVDRGNIKENPMFDIGFMGKTEYAISNNIKAAVYYREGINNIITPTNKYIDRNYIQFQVKCTIFNK
ncbi:MAG: hypothetical protein H7257_03980 [Taibaiella sp.]|nr:hypothetical protein [Taibaiella sp.]